MKAREKEFITAYTWMFGTTKKKAREVFKTADSDYVNNVIDGFKQNAKRCFYDD